MGHNDASATVEAEIVFEAGIDKFRRAVKNGTFSYGTAAELYRYLKQLFWRRASDRADSLERAMPGGPAKSLDDKTSNATDGALKVGEQLAHRDTVARRGLDRGRGRFGSV